MKEILLSNWNTWRIIRLILSVIFVVSGIVRSDYFLITAGVFVMYQAVLNAGCCSGGNCNIDYSKAKDK